jgi:hypothetical protein
MTSQTQNIFIVVGCICVLFGMFRLIFVNHRNPSNVSLVNWMFTGGLVEFVAGLFKGTLSLLRLRLDQNAIGALSVYLGLFIMWLAL